MEQKNTINITICCRKSRKEIKDNDQDVAFNLQIFACKQYLEQLGFGKEAEILTSQSSSQNYHNIFTYKYTNMKHSVDQISVVIFSDVSRFARSLLTAESILKLLLEQSSKCKSLTILFAREQKCIEIQQQFNSSEELRNDFIQKCITYLNPDLQMAIDEYNIIQKRINHSIQLRRKLGCHFGKTPKYCKSVKVLEPVNKINIRILIPSESGQKIIEQILSGKKLQDLPHEYRKENIVRTLMKSYRNTIKYRTQLLDQQ